jgi:hypothetical protein
MRFRLLILHRMHPWRQGLKRNLTKVIKTNWAKLGQDQVWIWIYSNGYDKIKSKDFKYDKEATLFHSDIFDRSSKYKLLIHFHIRKSSYYQELISITDCPTFYVNYYCKGIQVH